MPPMLRIVGPTMGIRRVNRAGQRTWYCRIVLRQELAKHYSIKPSDLP